MPTFRRLLLSPERLPAELKRAQDGVLVRLPVVEFDALVERAAQAGKRRASPQLLEARYHATLKEEGLIGEGQWRLVHPGAGPGLLSLPSFNLALRQARFENGDAVIASFDGKTPALLVNSPGERTVSLDWSARGEAGPEGLQFHLEMPPCPVALLELDVPAGRAVTVLNDSALLSGPHEAEKNDLRRWKIICGGRQRVDRQRVDIRIYPALRPAAGADVQPALFVHQKTTQKVNPEGLNATFELTLDGLSSGTRELVCECDTILRLRDVVGPEVEDYSFQPGAGKRLSRLTIRLREPVRAGTWKIFCLAPLNDETDERPIPTSPPGHPRSITWRSPGLHLVNGVSRGETLTLWLHPDLRVESWDAGSYRLSSSDLDRATGSQVLTLLGGGLGPPRRPTAHLQGYGVEFSTQQLTWWRCNASGMSLTVQIGWDVSQGQLFQLPVLLPEGWEVEKVEMAPSLSLGNWHVRKDAGKATLLVDLARPLEPRPRSETERTGETAPRPSLFSTARGGGIRLPSLTVQLQPTGPSPGTEQRLRIPDAAPLGPSFREGALALDCDEQLYHLHVQTEADRTEPESEGLWGQQSPAYYYRFRGQPVTGEILIRPRPPRLRAKCESEVLVAGGQAVVESHLLVEAEAGSPNTIELSLSAGDGAAWLWRTEAPRSEEASVNRIRRAERVYDNETSCALHLLAASHPLQATVVIAAQPAREHWRLTLARPLRQRESLRLHARHRVQLKDNRWEVPLPVVLGAERMEGEVVLHLQDAGITLEHQVGLQESATANEKGATPWRAFHYEGQNEVRLTLSGEARAIDRSSAKYWYFASMESARLLTYVCENGVLRHHFTFKVANWGERTLPLYLPPDSELLAVQVDGRWLPRLNSDDVNSKNVEKNARLELALPVPNRTVRSLANNTHLFEVVYTNTLSPAMLWQLLDVPVPQLPIAPIAFRRLWRLSPKLTPLCQEHYHTQPGIGDAAELGMLPRHAADLLHLPGPLARFDPLVDDQQKGAHEALNQVAQKLFDRYTDQEVSLREAVRDIAFDYLKDRYNLVIDELAFRQAAVGAETRFAVKRLPSTGETRALLGILPRPECGLIAVPARSAILLTTYSGRGVGFREPLSEEVENALQEAVKYGQDASGRFRSALSWLYPESGATPTEAQYRPLDFEYEGSDWKQWEPIAGQGDEKLIVVRRDGVTALGLALGLLLALLFGLLWRRSVRRRLTFLLVALAWSGLGVLWLPTALRDLAWWPLLASGAAAALINLRVVVSKLASSQAAPSQSQKAVSVASVAGMLAFGVFGWSGRAAAPAPPIVYLVPASAEAPAKQTVLVPADLLNRLKMLAQPAPLALDGPQAVLLDASYEGQLVEDGKQAEFAAIFSAHSLRDELSTLIVPLAGVQLVGEVLLDGARVAPVAAPQGGYSLSVRGRGRHKIELHFRVPVIGTVEDRNVLFTAPSLVRSRLSWRVPVGVVEPQVLVKNGTQWTTRAGEQRLEADLGALPQPVHLHWYQPGAPMQASYQGAYVWDLGLDVNRLTAYLRYRVAQGAIKTLELILPAELEVSTANAQRVLSASRPSWRSRFQLRDWYLTRSGKQRVLHLELPYPISGDFQVALELLPRTPLTSPAALPLPTPQGIEAEGPHYLAYRTQLGLNAQRDTSQNLTRIDPKEFAPNWLGGPALEANMQGIAYRIAPNKTPELFLRLEPTLPSVQGEVDLTVRVDSQRAEFEVIGEVTAPNKDLAALEWELPLHCVLATVTGEDVRRWKQSGSHLLVWLNRTTAKTRVHLSGWLPLSLRDGRSHLELSGPRLLNADKLHTRLRLAPSGDLVLAAVGTQNLQPTRSETRTKDRMWDFETWNSSYHLDCQVQAAANAVARVLTLAEVAGRELRFRTTVDYTVTQGELRQVRLRLRNWDDEKVEAQADRVALVQGPRRLLGERSWQLPLQAGVRGHYQVTLRGSMPLEKAVGGVPMPEILVQGVERAEYFVAVVGRELTGKATGSLQALKTAIPHRQSDPAISDLLKNDGQAWRVSGSDWQLRLLPLVRQLQPTPVRIYLLEHWAGVGDGRRWLHEARCWLHHEAHANLIVDFAAPIAAFTASVDGAEAISKFASDNGISDFGFRMSDSNKRAWLHLPGKPGVRCIRLRWIYDPPEPLDRPNLAPPQLVGMAKGPTFWTILVPPGWQASLSGASGWSGAAREAQLALGRADAQLHISQDLAREPRERAGADLSAAQQQFDLYCRHARHALQLDADLGASAGLQGQSLTSWLENLEAKNRSLKSKFLNPKFEIPTTDSDFGFGISALEAVGGIPLSWQALPDAEPPTLELTSRQRQQTRHAFVASGEWLALLAAVWLLSTLPFLRVILRLFWPEQIGLLGVIGWHLAGLTSIVLGLLLVALCCRFALLMRGLRALVRKRRKQPSTMTAGKDVML